MRTYAVILLLAFFRKTFLYENYSRHFFNRRILGFKAFPMGPGIGLTGVGKKLAKPFVPLFSWLWGRKLTEGSSKGDEIGTKIQVRKNMTMLHLKNCKLLIIKYKKTILLFRKSSGLNSFQTWESLFTMVS